MDGSETGRAQGGVAFAPTWIHRDEIPAFSPLPGFQMRALAGERLLVVWVTIEPNRELPRHRHPQEQAGFVLDGELELTIGDETRRLGPGDAYTIPPDLPHAGRTFATGALVIDVFAPPRPDYLRHAAGYDASRP